MLPTAVFVRQSRTGSGAWTTLDWARKQKKSSILQTDRTWRSPSWWCTENSLWPKELWSHTTIRADESTLLTEKEALLERWHEHFNIILNRPSTVNGNATTRLPDKACYVLLDKFPTVTETRKAIQQLSSGKAPGADALPAKFYKAGGLPNWFNACGGRRLSRNNSTIHP